jgi:CRISPR-associated protein Csx10
MHVKVIITAQGPLLFSERKPGGLFQESLPYVPGSVLRGALAALELNGGKHELPHNKEEDCPFCRLFLGDDAAVFTNAYPMRAPGEEVGVLPATAVSCKNNSGFLPPVTIKVGEDQDPPHGAFDTLIERLCWEELEPPALIYSPNCPICHGRVEAFTGFYVRHDHKKKDEDGEAQYGEHYHTRDVDQRLLTRVAINRRRMVAEDGLLYSPYVISQNVKLDEHYEKGKDNGAEEKTGPTHTPTRFAGYVWNLPEGTEETLRQITHLGGSSSRGLGHVAVEVIDIKQEIDGRAQAIKERVKNLDEEIQEVWKLFGELGGGGREKADRYFAVGLWSDAILRTAEGLPAMVFDAEMLRQATGIEATLVRSYASYGYSGGWQSAWRLPKPAEVLARCGSVYVFKVPALTEDDYKALADLEIKGVGARTVEGYGQVRISDAFHLKRREPNAQPNK